MADNEMPMAVLTKLIAHGVVKPASWPKFETLEKAIKAKRGIYSVENGDAVVNLFGENGYGSADQANEALTLALVDALDKVFPKLPGMDEQQTLPVDPTTGEIRERRTSGRPLDAARQFVDSVERSGMRVEITGAGQTVVIDGRDVDPDTREIASAIATDVAEQFDAAIDQANRDDIAKAFSAKGDGVQVIYDRELDEYRTVEGDIYAAGAVEDSVGIGR
jgi:hypothetical protein